MLRKPRRSAAAARTARRRRIAGLGLILLAGAAFAVGLSRGTGNRDSPREHANGRTDKNPKVELPRGGTRLLPDYRLVGFCGAPQDPALGALGIGSPAEAARELNRQARAYKGKRRIQPFFELIAVVANADPGLDGLYRTRQPPGIIRRYLRQARADRNLLVLDIQPGRARFSAEIDQLERFLRQPDVGLGIDPEWRVGDDEVPGQVIGSVSAREINRIAARLSKIVRENNLPEKLLIVHQFTHDMITDPEALRKYPGVAMVLNVDGFGTQADKVAKYRDLHSERRSRFFSGFKLFYEEDIGVMKPRRVLRLKPQPDLVVYE